MKKIDSRNTYVTGYGPFGFCKARTANRAKRQLRCGKVLIVERWSDPKPAVRP